LENGKVLCVKGNETGYFPVSEAYYIETKIFGNNILKRFPLVCIDRKRGNKKGNYSPGSESNSPARAI
jgi:hypothetical protein